MSKKISLHMLLSLAFQFTFMYLLCHSYDVDFAVRVSLKYFPICSVIILTAIKNPSDLNEVSNLEFTFKKSVPQEVPPSSHHLLGLGTMKTIDGARDLRKHTPYCRVIITFADGPSFNATNFLGLLNPREYPISLRDVDHHIFLTGGDANSIIEQELAQKILLSDIGRETKFKIVAMSNKFKENSRLLTFCLFCAHTMENPFGKSAIISVREEKNGDVSTLFPDFTKNFHHHPLKVVGPTMYISLYEMEKINGSKWYEHKRGMFTEFFFTMQGKLNFSYLLQPCSQNGNTGRMLPNGSWVGCVGDIYYRSADLSLGASPSDNRMHYVEFSTNMRYDYVQFFTHKPRVVYPWTVVFVCFDLYGWACVILSVVIGTLVLFKTEDFMNTPGPKLPDILYYLYAYLVGQDLCVEPRSVSSKVIYVNWLYYGIVVGAAYACSLQSLIVSPGLSMVPETMLELAGASKWTCGVPKSFRSGLAENIFSSSKKPYMKKLYRDSQTDKNVEQCLKRAATTDYACFHWQIMAEFYMGTVFIDKAGGHPFLYSKDYILFSGPTWVWRKREIWRNAFNDFFGRQFSMGIVYEASARDRRVVRKQLVQEVKDGKRKPLEAYTLDDDGPQAFTFENVKACFIVLLLGLIISLFAFIHEVIPKKKMEKLKMKFNHWLQMFVNCRKCCNLRK